MLRLLIVGRDASAIAALKSLANSNSWELKAVGSGCVALERLQGNHTPNLVIVDLARGEADGMYTLRWLRRMRPSLPVVLLGVADDTLHDEAIRLGGTITGEHGIGLAKKSFLPKFAGDAQMRVMRALRQVLDPNGILNPGKMFDQPGTKPNI